MADALNFERTTEREQEVLNALVETGGTNADIADLLGMKPSTVAVHIYTVMLKTDCHSRVSLALAWAAQRGDVMS